MSRIFTPTDDGWNAQPLEHARYRLHAAVAGAAPSVQADADDAEGADDTASPGPSAALLLRIAAATGAREPAWALLAGGGARVLVNGEPLALGVALLRHRDELRVGVAAPLYLSTERLATVETYTQDDAPRCPRCAQPIAREEAAVCCPGCGVRHHELPERGCWTYLPTCALCSQGSALDAGLTWTPEEL